MKYLIIRFFQGLKKRPRVIKTGLTLKEAQEWCNRQDTSKPFKWFDGYRLDAQ